MNRKRHKKKGVGVEPALHTIGNSSIDGYRSDSLPPSPALANETTSASIVYSLTRQSVAEAIDLSPGVALVPTPSEPTSAPLSSSSSSDVALPFFCVDFQLLLNTYLNAKQLSWSVQNQSSTVISKEAGSYSNRKTYNETYCLDPGDYTFTINDPGGKGLRAPFGNYTVKVDHEMVKEGGGYFDPVRKTQSTTFTIFPGNTTVNTFTAVPNPPQPARLPNSKKAPIQRLTNTPTANPTLQPQPSSSPTKIPTVSPTKQPTTSRPSKSPTRKPIRKPSKKPSNVPSLNPTPSPTKNPTDPPSKYPSTFPTLSPTQTPSTSTAPSKAPSMSPSHVPSSQPSLNPTMAPTPYSSYFETEVLIILTNVQGAMNESTEMAFRAVTQNFLQSNLPKEGQYIGYSCNITMLDVCSQVTSLSTDSNVFIKSYNRSYTIDGEQQRRLTTNGTQNLLVCLRIGGDLHPYNPGAEFIFPKYVLHGFEEDYRDYAIALSASGQTVFSEMKNSPSARIFGGPEWAVPTAILLAAAAVLFLACAFCCCFFWKRRRMQHKTEQREDPIVDGPTEEHPKPSFIMFPAEASSSFQQTELNNREQHASIPISSSGSSITQSRPSGTNPFSKSFDEDSREEEVPLVPRNENASKSYLSNDQEEEVPLVCGTKDKGESSETSLEDEDEENKTKSTTSTECDIRSKNSSSSEEDKDSINASSSQESEEEADINDSHPNKSTQDDENATGVCDPESSSRLKTRKDTVSHRMEFSSADYESENETQRYGVNDFDDLPQAGTQDDFIVIEKRKSENRSSTRRNRLLKSRLARP